MEQILEKCVSGESELISLLGKIVNIKIDGNVVYLKKNIAEDNINNK